jgi:hypothetical protein
VYEFTLTAAETNVTLAVLAAKSATAGVVLVPVVLRTTVYALDLTGAAIPTAAQNAAAMLDLADGIETGVTPRKAIRAIAALVAGLVSGAGTSTEVFKGIGHAAGGTTRVTVTADVNGNRSAITLNL